MAVPTRSRKPVSERKVIPVKIKVHTCLGFFYDEKKIAGKEAFGSCVFCGGNDKLYINMDSGMWNCKLCQKKGNITTFINMWYDIYFEQQNDKDNEDAWNRLANDRQLAPEILKEAGIVYDGHRYYIPIRNSIGTIVNLIYHTLGGKKMNLPGIELSIFGLEAYQERGRSKERVLLCEGGYDAIALRNMLKEYREEGVVLGIPGAGTFKPAWIDWLQDKHVICCYDNDGAGEKGTERIYWLAKSVVKSFSAIHWPSDLPSGYDVEEIITKDITFDEFMEFVKPYFPPEMREAAKSEQINRIPVGSKLRPTFEEVINVYKKYYYMTDDLIDALKVIFATIITTGIKDDPLWVNIVGPPSSGKTLLLLSTALCPTTYQLSTLTPNSLISGFKGANGQDESLIPKLNNRCLVLKDFTEVLAMPKMNKDIIFATLRGAFDGEAEKAFGTGTKKFKSHFNMVTGVTQQIYGDRTATYGERFLMFHILKGVNYDNDKQMDAAMRNMGKKEEINSEISELARTFLEVDIDYDDLPIPPPEIWNSIKRLAELVAVARANVERTYIGGESKLAFRPQPEAAIRLAKQFLKALIGLSLLKHKPTIDEEDYRIVTRLAIDTCVGFNLDIIASLVREPGQTIRELVDDCKIPLTTLKGHADDMLELGALRVEKFPNENGRGAPMLKYYATAKSIRLWEEGGLARVDGVIKFVSQERRKLKIRVPRKRGIN